MIEFLKTPNSFLIFSISGVVIVVIGSILTALVYRGKDGMPYSLLNHFISELGEVGVSRLAWVFNLSLILLGLCLLPAIVSLGLMINGILAKIAMAVGVVSAISLALVGVFPMNRQKAHGYAALTYFRAGLLMVLLFSLAIAVQPGINPQPPRLFSLAGLPPIFAFGAFLILIGRAYQQTEAPLATEDVTRPRVWHLAVVEWSIFMTSVFWFVLIALGI